MVAFIPWEHVKIVFDLHENVGKPTTMAYWEYVLSELQLSC